MKPITDFFRKVKPNPEVPLEAKRPVSSLSKTPEKRKYKGNSKEKNEEDTIIKMLENIDDDLKSNSETIKSKTSQVINEKEGIISQSNNSKSKKNIENNLVIHDSNSAIENQTAAPEKRPSLWDLPVYNDFKKSNKVIQDLVDTNFSQNDEENKIQNKSTEPNFNNHPNEESTLKSKLFVTESKKTTSAKKGGQRKISDFFLSNL